MKHSFKNLSINIFAILTLLLMATPAQTVHAAGIVVNSNADNTTDDGQCTLREALTNANDDAATFDDCPAGSGGDAIAFDAALGAATITLGSNLPNITDSDELTINGGGTITIDGADSFRVLSNNAGSTLILNHLTITNGYAAFGGGIHNNNSATLTIHNSTFFGNVAYNAGGGAILNNGTLTVTNSSFSSNSASSGGGIANGLGTATVINSAFISNTGSSMGGGLSNTGTLIIANSTFASNSSDPATGLGGGLYSGSNSPVNIYNSTFSDNKAGTAGGAGGGILTGGSGSFTLVNSIIADSTGEDCYLNSGSIFTLNNLIEGTGSNACGLNNGDAGNIIGSDPSLGSLTGSPAYFPLNPDSPAIDAGSDGSCAGAPVNNISQNGVIRPQGEHCDIGAYEIQLVTLTFFSAGANDGWILESTETSGTGGTSNKNAATLRLGDDAANKQYRALLSFDTSSLPDNAIITSVTLTFKHAGVSGTNPFSSHGKLLADICDGAYKDNPALQLGDFKAACSKNKALLYTNIKVNNWYSQSLTTLDFQFINLGDVTQFRLRFAKDDNNDFGADYLKLHSGNALDTDRPQLVIEYYVP